MNSLNVTVLQKRCEELRYALLAKAPAEGYLAYVVLTVDIRHDEVSYRLHAQLWLVGKNSVFEFDQNSRSYEILFEELLTVIIKIG